jgi:hypothetical protein
MEHCDCCGMKVDERSMATVGKHFVCQACAGYYSEQEIMEKIRSDKEGS